LKFHDLGQFSLIEDQLTESLFVQVNIAAKNVWEEYLDIYKNSDSTIFEKRLEFGKIKSRFYDYVVNIPVPRGERTIAFDYDKENGFYLIELESTSPFYPYSDHNFLENIGYQDVKSIFA
jgi:CRISPR-associated endonuclease/helicase Cas3